VAARVLRVSTTFRRGIEKLGVSAGSPARRAASATVRALASGELPGADDFETSFAPARRPCVRIIGASAASDRQGERAGNVPGRDLAELLRREGLHEADLARFREEVCSAVIAGLRPQRRLPRGARPRNLMRTTGDNGG
jgi:hypothetical protein